MKARFSEYNEVDLRKQEDGSRICLECKLNHNTDLVIPTIEDVIEHAQEHDNVGHKMWSSTIPELVLEKEIKDNAVVSITLYYAVQNNGDGSASPKFFKTAEEASAFDENMDEGWGEDCSGSEELHFDKDGVLINSHVEDDY